MPVSSSSSAPVTVDTTQWPAYATKADCLSDLEGAIGAGRPALLNVLRRLSNTDTTTWTDKGSTID